MGMLDDIKGRLGFGGGQEYDDYGDYDDYGEGYDDYADEPAASYDRYETVTTRDAGSRARHSSSYGHSAAGTQERRTTHTPLINFEDVKASTSLPDSLTRDPLPPRRTSSLGRASVGRASDFALSGTENAEGAGLGGLTTALPEDAAPQAPARRGGYNSLFDSSPTAAALSPDRPKPASKVGQGTHPAAGGYDPYQTYQSGSGKHAPTRQVVLLAPQDYGEVESVARSLKAGDAVVLSLRSTQSDLSKRILDFSFGVASALDATVDCVADKVFAITRNRPLDASELADLSTKGVI